MELGTIITSKRIEKQLTQEQLAKQLHVTKDTVVEWEDEKAYPDINHLVELAKLLDFSLDGLFLADDDTLLKPIMKQTNKHYFQFSIIICLITLIILLAILLVSLLNENSKLIISGSVILGELANLFALAYYIKKLN
ncbi:helix-turn-helix domain-containing protein [Vagococcus bubulae]|uniref:HTH cro/C1-type domain-containing protein n=1 Tax=Vagococcus bubulae TaxID=1977868 RepID=A0A429ZK47_9ENTE|nr:helix-turn-helix transcriptional regulator [Vagococcus bubulae]RST94064.1 hypothetical protein CBF36_06705 [Vagococcus bubulae]